MRNPDVQVKTVFTPSGVSHRKVHLEASLLILGGLEDTCSEEDQHQECDLSFKEKDEGSFQMRSTHRPSQGDALVSQTSQAWQQREFPCRCPYVGGTQGECSPPPPYHPRCTQSRATNIRAKYLNCSVSAVHIQIQE